ncbi:hypothetical protein K8T06_13880 [bacterium]|nr:hypothetical protein [bacterium]
MSKVLASKKTDSYQELTKQNRQKLDRAVLYINTKANEAVNTLLCIGKYLLSEFFDNDLAKVRTRAPRKELSLRKLAERDDLNLSYRSLSNAVRLAVQERRFFSHNGTFSRLTESHKILLLNLDTDRDTIRFAKEVVNEGLSVRKLKQRLVDNEFIELPGRRPKRLNRRTLPYQRLIKLVTPFSLLNQMDMSSIDIGQIPDSEKGILRQSALVAKLRLEKLIEHLS